MSRGFLPLPLSLLIPLTPSSPNATARPPSLFHGTGHFSMVSWLLVIVETF